MNKRLFIATGLLVISVLTAGEILATSENEEDSFDSSIIPDHEDFRTRKFDKITYKNGDVYEGEFCYGKRGGKGTYKYHNGDVYEGDWYDGIKHGKGTYKYHNGDVYEGDWIFGGKHGEGRMAYSNGNVYDGSWEVDCRSGHGKLMNRDGIVLYEGKWVRDVREDMVPAETPAPDTKSEVTDFEFGSAFLQQSSIFDSAHRNRVLNGSDYEEPEPIAMEEDHDEINFSSLSQMMAEANDR
jgi:hypothetical protein